MTIKTALELANAYMSIFYHEGDLEKLRAILADDLYFSSPLYTCHSAEDYIKVLLNDPPQDIHYEMLHVLESDNTACLIYNFIKDSTHTIMSQLFEGKDGEISRITLVFDARQFK